MSIEFETRYKPALNVETEVSSYDKVSAILQAMLMLGGICVAMMFLIWLTSQIRFRPRMAPIDITEAEIEGEEGEKAPLGVAEDLFEPGVEEFPEVEVPQLADALEAVTNAVSTIRAQNEFRDGDAAEMGKGRGLGHRLGGGEGGSGIIPEHKRWRIEYDSPDLETYTKQLSFFHIDIGAVSKDSNAIVRLKDPAATMQVVNTSRKAENKSLYFGHQKRKLQQWDERILKRIGITIEGNLVVQFYPEEVRVILRKLEKDRLLQNQRTLKQVKNTFFKIKPSGGGFEFEVTDQIYR